MDVTRNIPLNRSNDRKERHGAATELWNKLPRALQELDGAGHVERIAKAGVIITPSFFAEQIFGRTYHRWLIMDRGNCLFFFRKRPFEQIPFGLPPKFDKARNSWIMDDHTNPFDMLLNDEGWYKGQEGQMPKLSKILQKHWYAHSPLLEIVFLWDHEFQYKIFDDVRS